MDKTEENSSKKRTPDLHPFLKQYLKQQEEEIPKDKIKKDLLTKQVFVNEGYPIIKWLKDIMTAKNVVILCLALLFIATIYPPYIYVYKGIIRYRAWGYIFDPPRGMIDVVTLLFEYMGIMILSALFFVLRKK